MSLWVKRGRMQGNGGVLNYEIYTPARTLDVIFSFFERNIQVQSHVSCGIPQYRH